MKSLIIEECKFLPFLNISSEHRDLPQVKAEERDGRPRAKRRRKRYSASNLPGSFLTAFFAYPAFEAPGTTVPGMLARFLRRMGVPGNKTKKIRFLEKTFRIRVWKKFGTNFAYIFRNANEKHKRFRETKMWGKPKKIRRCFIYA